MLIETAKREVVALGDELREKGLADTFDVCALAFFRDILLGDGNPYSTDLPNKTSEKPMPLHLAIQMEENGDDIAHDGPGDIRTDIGVRKLDRRSDGMGRLAHAV